MKPFLRMTALASATAVVLAACSNDTDNTSDSNDTNSEALNVTASFYPLEYVAKEIGGDKVNVTSLTPPGSDAHNLELAPREVTQLSDADLVLYLSGFQAAMDDAVATASPAHALDVNEFANLEGEHNHDHGDHDHAEDDHAHEEDGHDHDHDHDHADDDHAHDEDGHDHTDETTADATDEAAADDHGHDDHGHDHSGPDPHFWLDPNRMAALADPVAEELAAIDPDNADYYRANAEEFVASMTELDGEYTDGLAQCETKTFVVTHEAFGYIARAYGLDQQAIAGLETDTEPSPARVAEVTDMIKELGVTTIFATSQAESSIADTFAAEANVEVGFLDALATQVNPDNDYEDVMESNLDELKNALNCQ